MPDPRTAFAIWIIATLSGALAGWLYYLAQTA